MTPAPCGWPSCLAPRVPPLYSTSDSCRFPSQVLGCLCFSLYPLPLIDLIQSRALNITNCRNSQFTSQAPPSPLRSGTFLADKSTQTCVSQASQTKRIRRQIPDIPIPKSDPPVSPLHLTNSHGIHEISITTPTPTRAAPLHPSGTQASRQGTQVWQVRSATQQVLAEFATCRTVPGTSLVKLRNSIQVLGEDDTA